MNTHKSNNQGFVGVIVLLLIVVLVAFALIYKDADGKTFMQKANDKFKETQTEVKQKTVGDFQDITDKREKQIEEATGEQY